MNSITDKIINKIKKEHLKPMPKWRFWLRDSGLWAGFSLFIFLAILSLGLLWYFLSDEPWHIGYGLFFSRMPILFFIFIILGALLSLFYFRNTSRGYRYSFVKLGFCLLVIVIIAGWSFNYFGISQQVDKIFGSSSLYQDRQAFMKEVWQKPTDGLLAGKIISIIDVNSFSFLDFDGKTWIVDSTSAIWRHNLKSEKNLEIKMIGKIVDNIFIAQDIRPWLGPGCGMMMKVGSCGLIK